MTRVTDRMTTSSEVSFESFLKHRVHAQRGFEIWAYVTYVSCYHPVGIDRNDASPGHHLRNIRGMMQMVQSIAKGDSKFL